MAFTRIASAAELPAEGEAREFPVGDTVVCIANINGTCSAMDNVCVHRGGPLGQGVVVDDKLVCPWHGWMYDPRTGTPDQNPNVSVKVYALKVDGDDVLIDL